VYPRAMCYLEVVDVNVEEVNVTMCVVCNCPFPLFNVVVSSYWHVYHPWCVVIWFKAVSICKEEHCICVIHP